MVLDVGVFRPIALGCRSHLPVTESYERDKEAHPYQSIKGTRLATRERRGWMIAEV